MTQIQTPNPIRITHGALDDLDGDIILRGRIDPESLIHLKIADYQREVMPETKLKDLAKAIRSGQSAVPDIQLGMRGGAYQEKRGQDTFELLNDVYIIDGLQRTSAGLYLLKRDIQPRLGAVVYFNTREEQERQMFRELNTQRTKLSANVLLYNERHTSPWVNLLYQLCLDSSFTLYKRISWQQRMKRGELISATLFVKLAARLHNNFNRTKAPDGQILRAVSQFSLDKIPRAHFRQNVRLFWQTLDDAFRASQVQHNQLAPFLRSSFLRALTQMYTDHQDFWNDTQLVISPDFRRKLASFPITDPSIAQLCSAGGSAMHVLYPMIVNHINSGKRSKRLKPVPGRGLKKFAVPEDQAETEEDLA
jgi:hypothetical protein